MLGFSKGHSLDELDQKILKRLTKDLKPIGQEHTQLDPVQVVIDPVSDSTTNDIEQAVNVACELVSATPDLTEVDAVDKFEEKLTSNDPGLPDHLKKFYESLHI